jgi:hypothetical protein
MILPCEQLDPQGRSPEELKKIQLDTASQVSLTDSFEPLKNIAGADCSYIQDKVIAVIIVQDAHTFFGSGHRRWCPFLNAPTAGDWLISTWQLACSLRLSAPRGEKTVDPGENQPLLAKRPALAALVGSCAPACALA